ncbi:hypothetical protein LZ32DRAFT_120744 [Colletotrichum eremochloae]|nr:hypothetical protein LZ32DRAFT_120744 [Colletotrichum eremochloae]
MGGAKAGEAANSKFNPPPGGLPHAAGNLARVGHVIRSCALLHFVHVDCRCLSFPIHGPKKKKKKRKKSLRSFSAKHRKKQLQVPRGWCIIVQVAAKRTSPTPSMTRLLASACSRLLTNTHSMEQAIINTGFLRSLERPTVDLYLDQDCLYCLMT